MNKKRTVDKSLGNNPDIVRMKIARARFNKLKSTPEFKAWRKKQWFIQFGKCAWCKKKMNKDQSDVHVDHILPIYHNGSNNYSNLCLSHASCNIKKWITPGSTPLWVRNRLIKTERSNLRNQQRRQFKELVDIENQEQIAQQLSWIA